MSILTTTDLRIAVLQEGYYHGCGGIDSNFTFGMEAIDLSMMEMPASQPRGSPAGKQSSVTDSRSPSYIEVVPKVSTALLGLDSSGFGPIHYAIADGDLQLVEYMIAEEALRGGVWCVLRPVLLLAQTG